MKSLNCNPWLSMWVYPADTIRSIIQNSPYYGVQFIVFILAFENLFFFFNVLSLGLGMDTLALVLLALFLAPFLGCLWLGILSHILFYCQRVFQGTAPLEHLKAALAWSKVTALGIFLSWAAILIIEPEEAFIQVGGGNPWTDIFHFINVCLAIWSIGLTISAVRAVEKFSLMRSIAFVSCGWLLFSIPVITIIFIFLYVSRF